VHRSDGSGTTFIFTDYLSKVSPEWKSSVGANSAVAWPRGIGGKGNEGVAGLVRQMPGAVGYVELIYALQNHIAYGYLRNAAGTWLKASIEGVTDAAGSLKTMPADFRVSITNAPGKDAYPISSFTYLLVPLQPTDATKEKVIKDFLNWMLDHGEGEVSTLDYAPLPGSVADKVRSAVSKLP
jgi:phosphate transport system substrate-binding protein